MHRSDETAPAGAFAPIRHLGDPYEQCRYAYDKIALALAAHGGTLADVVKQVVYLTDIRYQAPVSNCRRKAYANGSRLRGGPSLAGRSS